MGGGSSLEPNIQSWATSTSTYQRKKFYCNFKAGTAQEKDSSGLSRDAEGENRCSHGRKTGPEEAILPRAQHTGRQSGRRTVPNAEETFTHAWRLWEDVVQDFCSNINKTDLSLLLGQTEGCLHWSCLPTLRCSALLVLSPLEGLSLGSATSVCGKTFPSKQPFENSSVPVYQEPGKCP